MTSREQLRQRRDQALRDLAEVEQQQVAGELTDVDAARLRSRYEAEAADAIRCLRQPEQVTPALAATAPRGGGRARRAAYLATALAAVIAAAVLLPRSLLDRPPGGLVTGNEVTSSGATPSPAAVGPATGRRDLDTVSNRDLEEIVKANPDIVGMRLALADRYLEDGELVSALPHFVEVLRREPDNARAQAYLGWAYLLADRPEKAKDHISAARRLDPTLLDAQWFDANLRLHGLDDPAGALQVLEQMAARPNLPPHVAAQVKELSTAAQARRGQADGRRP